MKANYCIPLCIILSAALTRADAQTTFTQVTNGSIVNDRGNWVGCVWGDFHNSGFLDLVAANYTPGTNAYYQNNGGTFLKVSQGDPVQDSDYHLGAFAADYDNDGNLDLFVTAGGFASASHNRLYHNNGDGSFNRVSGGIVTNQLGYFGPAAWGDYDNDGFVDLYVSNHGVANPNGGTSYLYHNNGDGTFSKITTGAIVNDVIQNCFCAIWEDYDNDGYPDLLVVSANVTAAKNLLYHNNRDGTFSRILTNIIATDTWSQGAICAAWGDYDNDGLPDLFVTDRAGSRNQLYHNEGNGVFTRVLAGPELTPAPGGTSNGCGWGDYDNDGYLDLFVSGGLKTNALFHNNGNGTFTQILSGPPVMAGGPPAVWGNVTWADYDQDGFLDLFVGLVDPTNETVFIPGNNLLYHNNGNSNAWLEVNLVGAVANRSAIGAKIRAYATIGGKSFWQLREVGNSGGYNSQPLIAHFGLGDATNVDTLRIEWPSRTVQEFHNVSARQILTITEPPRLLATMTNGAPQFFLKAWPGMQFDIQSSTDLRNWLPAGTTLVTNMNGIAQIVDTNAPALDQRFYRAVSN
jgi:hypothetical protein